MRILNKKTTPLATLLTAGILASTTFYAHADVTDTIEKSFEFQQDGRIKLENINGDVSISACDCSEVSLVAEIEASSQEMRDRISIDIDHSSSSLSVKTRYKDNKGSSWRNQSSQVNYTLKVPNQVRLRGIELVNGDLTISGVQGELSADLVNGDVKSDGMTATTDIEMVNGSIDLSFSDVSKAKSIELESVNGSMTVSLPSDASFDVDAETVSGKIRNDFGLQVIKHKYVGSEMEGSIGSGDLKIEMSNVNGSIYLKQR